MSSSMFMSSQRILFSVDDIDDASMVKIIRNGGEVGARIMYYAKNQLMGHHGFSGFYPPNTVPSTMVFEDGVKWEKLLLAGTQEVWLKSSIQNGMEIVSEGPENA